MALWKSTAKGACIVSACLPAVLALIFGPYLHSYSELLTRSRTDITVQVINLDAAAPISISGLLTPYLQAAKAANVDSQAPIPRFVFLAPGDASLEELVRRVDEGEIWGGIAVNSGAGAALAAAIVAGNATGYDASKALTFVYDEGSTPTFSYRLTGPIKVLLTKFTSVFGQSLSHSIALGAFGGPSKLTQLAAYAPSLLNAPVGYTDVNTHPSWTQPIALHIFTVLLIGLIVLGGLGVVSMAVRVLPHPLAPVVRDQSHAWLALRDGVFGPLTPLPLLHARAVTVFISAGFVAGMYAVLAVGIAGSTYQGGGAGWARLWAIAWLLAMCYNNFMAGVHEILGDAYVTTAFLFLVYGSALAGWNLDLAPEGYRFFYCFPSWSGVRLVRHNLFGSRDKFVGMHVGILVGEMIFGILWYYAIALVVKPWLAALLRRRMFGDKPLLMPLPAAPAMEVQETASADAPSKSNSEDTLPELRLEKNGAGSVIV